MLTAKFSRVDQLSVTKNKLDLDTSNQGKVLIFKPDDPTLVRSSAISLDNLLFNMTKLDLDPEDIQAKYDSIPAEYSNKVAKWLLKTTTDPLPLATQSILAFPLVVLGCIESIDLITTLDDFSNIYGVQVPTILYQKLRTIRPVGNCDCGKAIIICAKYLNNVDHKDLKVYEQLLNNLLFVTMAAEDSTLKNLTFPDSISKKITSSIKYYVEPMQDHFIILDSLKSILRYLDMIKEDLPTNSEHPKDIIPKGNLIITTTSIVKMGMPTLVYTKYNGTIEPNLYKPIGLKKNTKNSNNNNDYLNI